jgi:FkbM family methyltransferase
LVHEFPDFNRPLVELVNQVHRHLNRPLTAIDVGASLGNTALLLMAECGTKIQRLHSIEGDNEFFSLLEQNTSRFPQVTRHLAMLAREPGQTRNLVHHHPGTAGATGDSLVSATTVDELLCKREQSFDVLKIDVDGSDGEVLAGAGRLLQRDQPAVIFEWHPFLLQKAGNDPFTAFSTLREHGYQTFLWFKNTGAFSHFSEGHERDLQRWQKYLLALHPHGDPHFDVIALPSGMHDLELPLASFGIAR